MALDTQSADEVQSREFYRQCFEQHDITYCELSVEDVKELDAKIRSSGVLVKGSFNFADSVKSRSFDGGDAQEVANFMAENLAVLSSRKITLADDSGDIGFRLTFDDFLKVFAMVDEFRTGHVYLCDDTDNLCASVHLALWTSVREGYLAETTPPKRNS